MTAASAAQRQVRSTWQRSHSSIGGCCMRAAAAVLGAAPAAASGRRQQRAHARSTPSVLARRSSWSGRRPRRCSGRRLSSSARSRRSSAWPRRCARCVHSWHAARVLPALCSASPIFQPRRLCGAAPAPRPPANRACTPQLNSQEAAATTEALEAEKAAKFAADAEARELQRVLDEVGWVWRAAREGEGERQPCCARCRYLCLLRCCAEDCCGPPPTPRPPARPCPPAPPCTADLQEPGGRADEGAAV